MLLLVTLLGNTAANYLPGVVPTDYSVGSDVPLLVNALTSHQKNLISYDYYTDALHMCLPKAGPVAQPESLGSIVFGDRLFSSPFEVLIP